MIPRLRDRFYGTRLVVDPLREEDAVAAFWEAGCLGVEVVSTARTLRRPRLTLRAYFPGRASRTTLARRIACALRAAGLRGRGALRLGPVADRRWAEAWQRSLRPMPIGRRFLVVPRGCRTGPSRGRLAIGVRFGQAFGTGEHASTRMCLRILEERVRPGDRVADLGTGTALLAMAAALLGARRVIAVDVDPVALRVAADNLADNRLADRVTLRCADAADACRLGPFDLALVNIGASVIGRVLPGLAGALTPGGRAVLAGILIEDEEALLRGAAALGLELEVLRRARPWSALVLRRGGV